jgi:putative spermidine/putrescine transport system ATP-binding protein
MNRPEGASLRLDGVCLSYGASPVIRSLSLEVGAGEMVALLGASGCGKTTTLKLIAGILRPDAGTIAIEGQPVNATPAEKRGAAMVFQKPLLFPYLSVSENVGFSLKMRGASQPEIQQRVREAMAMVRLAGYESRRPSQLSGGQEQRAALARALVSDPRILLLDEPFASLDENLRIEIRTLVRSIQRKLRITTIFVTHDRVEAAAMAHRIAFLHEGRIAQCGTLREFYEAPATVEAARFFGWQILAGAVVGGTLQTALGEARCAWPNGRVWAAIRPEAVSLAEAGASIATVESSVDLGARVRTVVLFATGETIEAEHSAPEFEPGGSVGVSVAPDAVRLFPREIG